jgi:acetyl-CoA carboxylase biotin carboxyl carrier protein
MADLTHEDVQKILRIIDEMGERDVHLEFGDLKLHVSRSGNVAPAAPAPPAAPAISPHAQSASAPAPVPAAAAPASAAANPIIPPDHVAIRAPTMGTFYRASSPGAKPHAEVGDHVAPDDTVGVFEVMKLFSTLKAGVAGTVTAIPASNEAMVQQDQVLVVIRPD